MKQFVILMAAVAAAYAGVLKLSDSEQAQKLADFARLCESGQVPQTGADINGVIVYCKSSPDKRGRILKHSADVSFGGAKGQAIFVRPSAFQQTHDVEVRGSLDGAQKQIYVVPSTVENKYRVRVIPGPPKPEKPAVFYLQREPSRKTVSRRGAVKVHYSAPSYDQEAGEYLNGQASPPVAVEEDY